MKHNLYNTTSGTTNNNGGVTSPVDSGCSGEVINDLDAHGDDSNVATAAEDDGRSAKQASGSNNNRLHQRRRSMPGLNHKTTPKNTAARTTKNAATDLSAVAGGVDPSDKAFIRRAHTNLTIALRTSGSGGVRGNANGSKKTSGARVTASKMNNRRKSIDCPYQVLNRPLFLLHFITHSRSLANA